MIEARYNIMKLKIALTKKTRPWREEAPLPHHRISLRGSQPASGCEKKAKPVKRRSCLINSDLFLGALRRAQKITAPINA